MTCIFFNEQSFISGIGNWIADEVLYQVLVQQLAKLTKNLLQSLNRSNKLGAPRGSNRVNPSP